MINSLGKNTELPPRFASAKFSDIPVDIQKKIKSLIKEKKGLYLWGNCGTGKTHIAYGIIERCIKKKVRAKLYNSPELLDVIRDFYGKNSYDYRDNDLKMLIDYEGILIIDDIGAEKQTEWVAETFYKIINVRYEKMLPTIFTSNLSLEELAGKIGDRVPSRIIEMCEIIKLKGKDRRL